MVTQKAIRLYAHERGLSGEDAWSELKDWLRWHERMRLFNDISLRAWTVRGWREWLGDVTYKPIRWRVWRRLDIMYLSEWPEGHALRGWDWFRCLRLRWWLVVERDQERFMNSQLQQDQARDKHELAERRRIYDRGFDDGAMAQTDTLERMWESPHRPTDEEMDAIKADIRAKYANPYA